LHVAVLRSSSKRPCKGEASMCNMHKLSVCTVDPTDQHVKKKNVMFNYIRF